MGAKSVFGKGCQKCVDNMGAKSMLLNTGAKSVFVLGCQKCVCNTGAKVSGGRCKKWIKKYRCQKLRWEICCNHIYLLLSATLEL